MLGLLDGKFEEDDPQGRHPCADEKRNGTDGRELGQGTRTPRGFALVGHQGMRFLGLALFTTQVTNFAPAATTSWPSTHTQFTGLHRYPHVLSNALLSMEASALPAKKTTNPMT